jgi:MFS family permease
MVFLALTMTVAGRFYDRYGPKGVIFISTVLLAAGYICTSWMHTLWQFHLFYGVLTAIGTGGATIPLVAVLMSKWFEKYKGLTISLALSGACLGQFFLVPIFNRLVLIYSWRISYLLIGLIILVVNTILAFTVFKGDPEDLGIQPYGRTDTQNRADPDGCGNSVPSAKDLNLKQAMKTYSFWLFLVSMFICGGGDFLIIIHLVPFATDYGVAPTAAANMLALSGLMSLGGILIAGPVSDLIGNKIPIAASFVLRLLLFLMILKYRTPISFYIFAGGFGFTLLITAPLVTTLTGRLYGFAHLGLISGFVTTIHHLGGGFWTYMGGLLFDKTGSYQIILAVSAVLAVIATICTMALKEKRHLI